MRAWQIDGQILELTLDGPYVITAVRILPGVDRELDGQDQWLRYRTVSRGLWSFDDPEHTKVPQVTGDRRELLTQPVAPASCASKPNADCRLVASHVWLTIVKTTQPANPTACPQQRPARRGDDFSAFGSAASRSSATQPAKRAPTPVVAHHPAIRPVSCAGRRSLPGTNSRHPAPARPRHTLAVTRFSMGSVSHSGHPYPAP
ncbi:hypothetical protein I553_10735 [Mycobacterium xenopi 4042]|uniref:Uncharacterized protein n=1 Tax=Mycobacterium xenopi 4042 TaxID=1299334 RepID=X8DCH3_MYCXE|nr:hypothetical protein I553_10735 [Mycobacterium xenopi 4042]